MRWKPPEGGAHACAGQRRALPDARGGSVNRSASERGAAPPNAAVTEEVRPVHRTPSALRSCPPSHAPVAHRLLVKAAAGQRGQPFRLLAQRACHPLWQRHIRCTPCAWWQGHPGHALCSKECGRCGLVTRAVRCCARHPRHTTLGLAIGGSRRIRIQVSLVRFPGRALWYCEGARGATLRQGLSAPPSARGVSTSPAAWPLLPAPACGGGLQRRLAAAACGGGLRRLRRRAKGDIWCVSSARLPPRI